MGAVQVVAPYVTLKVRDREGGEFVTGFYAGAVVADPVEGESLDKHLRTGMVQKVSASKSAEDDGADKPAKVEDILAEVGDDKDKAAAALEQENARGKDARSTLVAKLQAVVDAS